MPELLVLFACLNNIGCQETSVQYNVYNPYPATVITNRVIALTPPPVLQVAPLLNMVREKKYFLPVGLKYGIIVEDRHTVLTFNHSF